MKIDNIRRISREELQDAPEWIDRLLDPLNNSIEMLTQACMGQLEFSNNQLARIVSQNMTQGVELVIANPFRDKLKPIGAIPILTESPYMIDSYRMESKSNGDIGIKVNFAIDDSYLFLTRNANVTIAFNTVTPIAWTTNQASASLLGNLSWSAATNPSRITANTAGRYAFTFTGAYEADATGRRQFWLSKNATVTGAGSRFGSIGLINNSADVWAASGAAIVNLSSGDYIELYTWHNVAAGLDALGNSDEEVQIMAHSLDYSGYSAGVTFVIFGG